jgi:hypothetical protein
MGDVPEVALYDDSDAPNFFGVSVQAIPSTEEGFAAVCGEVTCAVRSNVSAGDALVAHATNGFLTPVSGGTRMGADIVALSRDNKVGVGAGFARVWMVR